MRGAANGVQPGLPLTPAQPPTRHRRAGRGAQCDGADGDDLEVRAPLGTIIRRKGAGEDELLEPGQRALLLVVGGRGGRRNLSFKTRRNTAPAFAERGEAGAEEYVDLELKVRGCACVWGSAPSPPNAAAC